MKEAMTKAARPELMRNACPPYLAASLNKVEHYRGVSFCSTVKILDRVDVCMTSTGVHAPFDGEDYHLLEYFQVGKYDLYQFPWLRTEATTNQSCGISILFNRRFFSPIHICQTWNAPEGLHGRAGAIR
eukprot:7022620-Heterocapsa_arctica.AAC.1